MKQANEFLKECLGDALLELMKKKNFSDITVSEVAKFANVSRSTYYRHFISLEEVLRYKLNLLLNEWVAVESAKPARCEMDIFISLFTYLQTIKEPLMLIIKAKLEMLILSSAYQIFEEDLLEKEVQYRQAYHSFGLSGMILSWLKRGMKEPLVQMAEILVHIIMPFTSGQTV